MAEKVVSAINRALLPQIQEIKGEFKGLNARIDAMNSKFDVRFDASDSKLATLESRTDTRFNAIDSKLDAFRSEFRAEVKRLDEKIDTGFKHLDEKITSL
jgi:hypothetical protein